jgi:hypothetical protein
VFVGVIDGVNEGVGVSVLVGVTEGVGVGVGVFEGVGGGNPPLTAAATPRRETPLKDENSLAADCLDLAKSLKLGGVAILIFISQGCNLLYFLRYNKCFITWECKASSC